jgi:hypothetical protein
MIFASSDVASLLHRWEVAEYISEVFVIVGCAGELVADFFTRLPKKVREHIGTWSTVVLILALTVGLKCLIKTNELSGSVIGSLGDKAEEAGRKANTATANSETALTKSGQALDEANGAEKTAGKAQKVAGAAASKAENLDRQLGATKTDLDTAKSQLAGAETAERKEEQALINLAVCNAPRVVPLWSTDEIGNIVEDVIMNGSKWTTSVDPLKPFASRQAIIEFVPDAEARRAALSIAEMLKQAGWKIVRITPVDGIDDGTDIEPYKVPITRMVHESREQQMKDSDSHLRASEAADALVGFLHSYNWQAKRGWPLGDDNIPPDGLKVRVGLYPPVTYVTPPGAKDLAEATAKFEQQRENSRKQIEKQQAQTAEDILKRRGPEQAAEYKAHIKDFWQEWDKQPGPCRPLTSLFR